MFLTSMFLSVSLSKVNKHFFFNLIFRKKPLLFSPCISSRQIQPHSTKAGEVCFTKDFQDWGKEEGYQEAVYNGHCYLACSYSSKLCSDLR